MKHRPASRLPLDIYPVDPWSLVERGFNPAAVPLSETLFALANGYLGVRGSFEEGLPSHEHGTFVNGFHETWPIVHPEEAYGLASVGQTILGLPDATAITLHIDDEPMLLSHGRLLTHERRLDLRRGVVEREFEWESPSGVRLRVRSHRFVSFVHRHLAAFRFEIRVVAGHGRLVLSSRLVNRQNEAAEHELDPRRAASLAGAVEPLQWEAVGDRLTLSIRTRNSGMMAACGAQHVLTANTDPQSGHRAAADEVATEYTVEAQPGTTLRLDKFAVYHASAEAPLADLAHRVDRTLQDAIGEGFDKLLASQRQYLDDFWAQADVRVEGDRAIQQAVRWNLFQLAQATLRADGQGVPAKGLTGGGYDGHYFWDTEIYLLPFLIHASPQIARDLLRFRHGMLDAARRKARTVGERGALFPWRTINGEEASAYYWAGTAQYHIDADVAYALRKYVELTGDEEALREFGAEILVETARLWTSLGFHAADTGAFHIHGVTGPDEYTAVVDDNTYTNLMARENLSYAALIVDDLRARDPDWYRAFSRRLQLDPAEVAAWRRAAAEMFVPYDERRGVHPQDAHFLEKEVWDFAATPPGNYPLLLHYHPLVLYRFQVLKQADVVQAMLLLSDRFTPEQRRANFAYYEPITTGDSSLSHAVQSMMAAEVEEDDLALMHFGHALFMDLGNWAGNAEDGVHIASAAGVWLALVYGFAGLRDHGGRLRFDPHLPVTWNALAFSLRIRNQALAVRLSSEAIVFDWSGQEPLLVTVRGREFTVPAGTDLTVSLADRYALGGRSPEATSGSSGES